MIADTNVILDWLLVRNKENAKRATALFSSVTQPVHVPDFIMVELVFALERHYSFPRPLVIANLSAILGDSLFDCNKDFFQAVLPDYEKHPSLSFVDCCILQYAERRGDLPVWTSDKKMVNQASGRAQLLKKYGAAPAKPVYI